MEFKFDLNKINTLISLIDQRKKEDGSLPEEFKEVSELANSLRNKYQLSGEYTFWILHRYANKLINRWEDIGSRVIPSLIKYQKLKNKKKITGNLRDINQIKSLFDLEDLLDNFPDEELTSGKEQDKEVENQLYKTNEATLIYNDVDIKVVVPHTKEASCYFGKNTRWCTAAKYENQFDYYNKKGPLYIVLIKRANQRYQFSFAHNEYVNDKDIPVEPDELADQYPKLWEIFMPVAEKENSIILNKNPSEEIKLASVSQHGHNLQYIKNPSEEIQLAAVKENGYAIQYINNPSEEVQLAAVKRDGNAIKCIKNPSEKIKLVSSQKYGNAIQHIENPTEEMKLAAVNQNGYAIKFIESPSEEVQLAAVSQNGYVIKVIVSPSEDVQLAAVRQNGFSINNIETPSEEVQLASILASGFSIQYIKNPSEEVKLTALKKIASELGLTVSIKTINSECEL